MNATTYKVTVSHPTNFHSGTHEITVKHRGAIAGVQAEHRNCDGRAFGYSRDYNLFAAKTDKEAIAVFLREHGCTVVKCVKVRQPK
jgi:2',3'-cyclic-nucleotide 2'-phosphodiesterase (5'-nucleotidase family)